MTPPSIDDAAGILADLIAFPTVSSDSNLEMIAYLADRLDAVGARVEIFGDPAGRKANLFATLGPEVSGGVVLSGHCDVVPVADQSWSTDPFEMTEKDGRLYGRGACDMKGFIAATIAAAPALAAKVRDRPLHFAFTHDEETGCIGAGRLAEVLRRREVRPGVAVIGEPTEMRVVEGHKGCFEYTARIQGLEGHGSEPDRGVNAAEHAALYVARLLELKRDLRSRAPEDSRFEPPWTTINVGAISGGSVHNVIPPKALIAWEMRPVRAEDADFVKRSIRRYCDEILLPAMRKVCPDAAIEVETIGEVDGLVPAERNEARELMLQLTGENAAGLVPFGTEAGIFQNLGMDVVVCGPGSIEQAHKADEHLSLDQLAKCLKMLERLGDRLRGA